MCTTFTELYVHFEASVLGTNSNISYSFLPCRYNSAICSTVVCLHGVCIAGMYLRISKALVSQSFIESSSWLRVFLKKKKKCLFCLLDLLFLVSEYCASRKKSLNC